jgi:hypothetical protein
MGFPEDAIQPFLDCVGPGHQFPGIAGPGGLPNFMLASFTGMLAGINWILDFIPPDPGNLPSPPDPNLFINAFLGGLNFPGDRGELDFSIVIPGAPTIPATGPNIVFPQGAHLNLILICVAVPFGIIGLIVDKIIDDLVVEIPGIPDIILLIEAAISATGLSGLGVLTFTNCFATALFNMVTALVPV